MTRTEHLNAAIEWTWAALTASRNDLAITCVLCQDRARWHLSFVREGR